MACADAPAVRDLAGHGLGGGAIDVGDVDVRALGREQEGGGPADAGARPRHQRDAALETRHRNPTPSWTAWPQRPPPAAPTSRAW